MAFVNQLELRSQKVVVEHCDLPGLDLCELAMAGATSTCFDPVPFNESIIRKSVEPRTGVFVLGPLKGDVIRVKHVGCARTNLRETLLSLVPPGPSELYIVWSYCDSPEVAETLREVLTVKYLKKAAESREHIAEDVNPPSSQ